MCRTLKQVDVAYFKRTQKKMNGKWYPQVVIIDMIIGKSVQTKEAAGRLADLPALRPGDYYSMLGNFGKVPGESINSGRTVKLKDFVDSTIDLCLSVFEWAKFRKHKGGIKLHSLYDVEAEVPAFVHITSANIHDSKAMPEIPYEPGAHYVFDRGYNDFSNLYTINRIGAFFVVRAKVNVRIKPKTRKRRLPEGVVSDIIDALRFIKVPRITRKNLETPSLKTRKTVHFHDEQPIRIGGADIIALSKQMEC